MEAQEVLDFIGKSELAIWEAISSDNGDEVIPEILLLVYARGLMDGRGDENA